MCGVIGEVEGFDEELIGTERGEGDRLEGEGGILALKDRIRLGRVG